MVYSPVNTSTLSGAWEPARGHSAMDDGVEQIYLLPAKLIAPTKPTLITTILGSCVAVCLWDEKMEVGGMNHFVMPEGGQERMPDAERFGDQAVRLLIEALERVGAQRSRLQAKLFGGAHVLASPQAQRMAIGDRNVARAKKELRDAGINVIAESVGGTKGRKVIFESSIGMAWVKLI